jgi:nicotinamidase-related amidase
LAEEHQILTLIGEPNGIARNGSGAQQRIFIKHGGNAFYGTEVGLLLRSACTKVVLLVGPSVGEMVLDAADAVTRGYEVAILAAPEQAAEAGTLITALFAGREDPPSVRTLEELEQAWSGLPQNARNWHGASKDEALLRSLEERLDPAHTTYVLIDVQNDFCNAGRELNNSFSIIDAALPNMAALLASARSVGSTVIHIQVENGPFFRGPGSPRRFPGEQDGQFVWTACSAEFAGEKYRPEDWNELCQAGTWGEQIFELVAPLPGEIVIRKHRFSAFIDTGLDVILRKRGVRTIVLVGLITNVCVESTARDAAMMDFYVVLAEDGVGVRDMNKHIHNSSLAEIRGHYGLTIPAQQICEIWDNYRAGTRLA